MGTMTTGEATVLSDPQPSSPLPPMPEIGHPETYYARLVLEADRAGNKHAHASYKVGQYITLGLDPHLTWEEKLKYFDHALRRHCVPPQLPEEREWDFYKSLAMLVKQYAGQEALRIASQEDDLYAARLAMGQSREDIENEAEEFFARLVPGECPDWLTEEDYNQLKLIRDQWI